MGSVFEMRWVCNKELVNISQALQVLKWDPRLRLKEEASSIFNLKVLKDELECTYPQQTFQFQNFALEEGTCQNRFRRSNDTSSSPTQSTALWFDEKILILPSGYPVPVSALLFNTLFPRAVVIKPGKSNGFVADGGITKPPKLCLPLC